MAKPSSLIDTRVIYCGDNVEQLAKLPPQRVDLIYIDPPFMGIDGRIFPIGAKPAEAAAKGKKGQTEHMCRKSSMSGTCRRCELS